eukprot:jgi/Bigna1/135135/aug1.28_g9843
MVSPFLCDDGFCCLWLGVGGEGLAQLIEAYGELVDFILQGLPIIRYCGADTATALIEQPFDEEKGAPHDHHPWVQRGSDTINEGRLGLTSTWSSIIMPRADLLWCTGTSKQENIHVKRVNQASEDPESFRKSPYYANVKSSEATSQGRTLAIKDGIKFWGKILSKNLKEHCKGFSLEPKSRRRPSLRQVCVFDEKMNESGLAVAVQFFSET